MLLCGTSCVGPGSAGGVEHHWALGLAWGRLPPPTHSPLLPPTRPAPRPHSTRRAFALHVLKCHWHMSSRLALQVPGGVVGAVRAAGMLLPRAQPDALEVPGLRHGLRLQACHTPCHTHTHTPLRPCAPPRPAPPRPAPRLCSAHGHLATPRMPSRMPARAAVIILTRLAVTTNAAAVRAV